MKDIAFDLMIEASAVQGQLDAGLLPSIVASRSSLGGRAVSILSSTACDTGKFKSPKWTKDEDNFLISCLGILSEEDIAEALGRTVAAVHLRWKRELMLPAISKRSDVMTCNQIANGLCIDSHTAIKLLEAGILPGRLLPFNSRVVRVVNRVTLLRFIVNPMNWIYFKPDRVDRNHLVRGLKVYDHAFWAHARRLVLKQRSLWKDEWWRIGEVARYHGLHHKAINKAIHDGRLQAKDWGNWWVLKSHATDPDLRLQTWTGLGGKGQDHFIVSPRADAFVVLAEAVGLMHSETGALMGGWKDKKVAYRLHVLRERNRIPAIIESNLLNVFYDKRTHETFADWTMHRDTFPRLARLMDSLDSKPALTVAMKKYITRVEHKTKMFRLMELMGVA